MIVSLDQVNALAKSKYKNYMITVQSADSMMLSDLAEEEDILATSIPNPIERFFTFLTLEVRDTEVDKAMLEMRITLAKEDKIKGTGRSAALAKKDKSEKSAIHDNFIEVCRSLSDDLTKSAKTLCETKYYKNTQFDVGSRIAFIDELNSSGNPDCLRNPNTRSKHIILPITPCLKRHIRNVQCVVRKWFTELVHHNALNYTIHYQFNHSTVNVLYHTIPRRSPKGRRNR